MRLTFAEFGQGRPVVLLHAFPLSRQMWEPQITTLAEAGCRVILPDFPGFGETPLLNETSTMEDLAAGVVEILDHLKIDKAVIGGLSMGGYVTLNLYRLFPERFAAMILADTSSFADTEEKRQGRLKLIGEIESDGMQAVVDAMLPNLVGETTKADNPQLVEKLAETFRQTNPQAAIAALRGMAARRDHTERLKEISVPALLIFGAEDKVTNLDGARKLEAEIPDAALFIIEKAGHYSNQEAAEKFNEYLSGFVRQK
jgi:3-oxoadipate enol-lactonase